MSNDHDSHADHKEPKELKQMAAAAKLGGGNDSIAKAEAKAEREERLARDVDQRFFAKGWLGHAREG